MNVPNSIDSMENWGNYSQHIVFLSIAMRYLSSVAVFLWRMDALCALSKPNHQYTIPAYPTKLESGMTS